MPGASGTIGVLTSGGDCAGLNAAIRAVVHRAVHGYGWRVMGILDSTEGLMARPVRAQPLDLSVVTGDVLRRGGTILGTVTKGNPFAYPMPDGTIRDRSEECIEGIRQLGLDALIGIGGDGSMKLLHRLAEQGGFVFVGIPKTIDNDVPFTEFSIGFATAVSTAVEALDRLQATAASHRRVMVLEVMGRDAGHIALDAGIAGGADAILIPEIPYDMAALAAHVEAIAKGIRRHALVVCSEAAWPAGGSAVFEERTEGEIHYGGIGHVVARELATRTGAEVRVTVLGHVQRGGTPASRDRIIASAFGVAAVDLATAGKSGRMVAWRERGVVDVPLAEVVKHGHPVALDSTLVRTARGLGICLGD